MTTTAKAVVAGGCFWCTEAAFEQLEGVLDVASGYAGGAAETANYRAVCSGNTGHAEAIRITYDPAKISYDQLLAVFFDAHDPTQLNRQGNDAGTQYRSAIFYADESQRRAAQAKIDELNKAKKFPRPIVTTLEPLTEFYPAEDYHQDYARLNPDQPYIQAVSMPKVCKVRDKYAGLVRRGG
jgi:methionine-S-sulfoxide reductase